MFADQVLEAAGTEIDRLYCGALTSIAAKIREAQRFCMSSSVMEACNILAIGKPSALASAIPLCRIPFKTMWLEWDGAIPGRELGEPRNGVPIYIPAKYGALIECLDDKGTAFGVTCLWRHKPCGNEWSDPKTGCDPKLLIFPNPAAMEVDWEKKASHVVSIEASKEMAAHYGGDMREVQAVREIASHIEMGFTPHCALFVDRMVAAGHSADELLHNGARDMQGDLQLIMALLCLINSRNCLDVTKVEPPANKARLKRGNKPLLGYSEVQINLSKRDANAAKKLGLSQAEIRRHIVRGHFKIRKGGVFWWRPFIRGNPVSGEVLRSAYSVTSKEMVDA